MKWLHYLAFTLVILGALNWGLVALFDLDIVEAVLGGVPMLATLAYVAIAASAVYLAVTHKADCKICAGK